MIIVKFIQGAVTSFIPPGLNSITQGIVGADGMTEQVSTNEMMNHLGTAFIVLTGSLVGFAIYPDLGWLFIVSPIACVGVIFFLNRIRKEDIDHDAARGLAKENKDVPPPTNAGKEYTPPANTEDQATQSTDSTTENKKIFDSIPSFNFGWGSSTNANGSEPHAETPLKVLRDPILLTFIAIVFLFHTANGTVLPLVMQTLAIGSGRTGIVMSGNCILVAQIFMVMSAKICGDYSGKYGRKPLFLIGLFTVPVRCLILTALLQIRGDEAASPWMQFLILATQVLDGVGAGTFGTMYILVTSDISDGTGRFSMILGVTTAAMSIGGTVSGYLGEALAEDLGYMQAFFILMFMSLVPALLYLIFMPETLPALSKAKDPLHAMHSIKEEGSQDNMPVGQYKELV